MAGVGGGGREGNEGPVLFFNLFISCAGSSLPLRLSCSERGLL